LRELPITGELLVNVGESVAAQQKIGRSVLPGELLVLRLPEMMSLDSNEVMSGLLVREGESVRQGQTISEVTGLFGLFKTVATAPFDGVIEHIASIGHVTLRLPSRELLVDAYISGKVVESVAGQSVMIECECAYVQGVFGVGGAKYGKIVALVDSFDRSLTVADLPHKCAGDIIVGGATVSVDVLEALKNLQVAGLVTGSIDSMTLNYFLGYELGAALTGNEDVPFTLIVTEGFGSLAMSRKVRVIFKENDGKLASINGATQVRAGSLRPEIIIPLQETSEDNIDPILEDEQQGLAVGRQVIIIRAPYFGAIGTVLELPVQPIKLPTGAFSRIAVVEISDQPVIVPRANIELS
jgi:hypothetical protein